MKDKLRFSYLGLVCVCVQPRNVSEDKILDKGSQDFKKYYQIQIYLKNLHIFLKIKALIQFNYK